MKKITSILFLTSLIMVGCATTMLGPNVRSKKETNYTIGEKKRADMGNPIFKAEVLKEVDCYIANKTFTPPKAGAFWEGEIKTGQKFYTVGFSKEGDVLIRAQDFPEGLAIRIKADGSVSERTHGELQTSKNGSRGWMISTIAQTQNLYLRGYASYAPTPSANEYAKIDSQTWPLGQHFSKSKVGYPLKGSFRAELIYTGTDGNNIKLTYREFADDFARPAFSQELSYNLKESKIIGYKSVKIKILEATNSFVSYEVIEDGGLPWLPEL